MTTKKEIVEKNKRLRQKVKDAITISTILCDNKLVGFYWPESFFIVSGKITIDIKAKSELPGMRKKLNTLFPDIKYDGVSLWSPHGDTVICQWLYTPLKDSVLQIAVWLKTDIQHIPKGLLTDKCKFVEQETKSYALVCEKDSL